MSSIPSLPPIPETSKSATSQPKLWDKLARRVRSRSDLCEDKTSIKKGRRVSSRNANVAAEPSLIRRKKPLKSQISSPNLATQFRGADFMGNQWDSARGSPKEPSSPTPASLVDAFHTPLESPLPVQYRLAPPRLSPMEYARAYLLDKTLSDRDGRPCELPSPKKLWFWTPKWERFLIIPSVPQGIDRSPEAWRGSWPRARQFSVASAFETPASGSFHVGDECPRLSLNLGGMKFVMSFMVDLTGLPRRPSGSRSTRSAGTTRRTPSDDPKASLSPERNPGPFQDDSPEEPSSPTTPRQQMTPDFSIEDQRQLAGTMRGVSSAQGSSAAESFEQGLEVIHDAQELEDGPNSDNGTISADNHSHDSQSISDGETHLAPWGTEEATQEAVHVPGSIKSANSTRSVRTLIHHQDDNSTGPSRYSTPRRVTSAQGLLSTPPSDWKKSRHSAIIRELMGDDPGDAGSPSAGRQAQLGTMESMRSMLSEFRPSPLRPRRAGQGPCQDLAPVFDEMDGESQKSASLMRSSSCRTSDTSFSHGSPCKGKSTLWRSKTRVDTTPLARGAPDQLDADDVFKTPRSYRSMATLRTVPVRRPEVIPTIIGEGSESRAVSGVTRLPSQHSIRPRQSSRRASRPCSLRSDMTTHERLSQTLPRQTQPQPQNRPQRAQPLGLVRQARRQASSSTLGSLFSRLGRDGSRRPSTPWRDEPRSSYTSSRVEEEAEEPAGEATGEQPASFRAKKPWGLRIETAANRLRGVQSRETGLRTPLSTGGLRSAFWKRGGQKN